METQIIIRMWNNKRKTLWGNRYLWVYLHVLMSRLTGLFGAEGELFRQSSHTLNVHLRPTQLQNVFDNAPDELPAQCALINVGVEAL